jgi:hypothetical protein
MATGLTFTGTLFTSASMLLSSSQTAPVVIAQGGTNGSRVYGLAITTNTTTAAIHVLSLSSSMGANRISALSVTAFSGWTAGTAQFDYFGNAVAAAVFQKQKDANGVPYFNLAPNTSLIMHTSGTFITTGTTSSIFTIGEFY